MIRTSYIMVLIITLLFSGGYVYSLTTLVCPAPLAYRIGTIDPSFELTTAEAQAIIADAATVWEAETDQPLFTYDEEADFTINFVFDERQESTNIQQSLRDQLDQTQSVTEELESRQQALVQEYEAINTQYEETAAQYETELAAHNARVASYNEEGGAPPDVYEELEVRAQELEQQRQAINQLAETLNQLGSEINTLSSQGTAIVETYNRGVLEYNDRFGEAREFTQGSYQSGRIDIYSFTDHDELRLVLAHELGHALSLGHIENEESVMHYLMGAQPRTLELTHEDTDEFHRVCTDYRWWDIITEGWRTILY